MNRVAVTWHRLRDWRRRYAACRAYDEARRRTRLPGPIYVQVQTIDLCNQRCLMCPYSARQGHGSGRRMEAGLYSRILEELRRAGTVTEFSPMLQNEPLLDPALGDRVAEARRVLGGNVRIDIVTNGTLLTPDRGRELIARGTDLLEISLDAATEETYAAIHKSGDFDKVRRHVEALVANPGRARVRVRFLWQAANEAETARFKAYWRARGAEIAIGPMGNRAGTLAGFGEIRGSWHRTTARRIVDAMGGWLPSCTHPFTLLSVLHDGRAPLCCGDWGPEAVLGDLSTQTLPEVWNGETINRFRAALRARRPDLVHPCRGCSVVEGTIR